MPEGYVYILMNPSLRINRLKIGATRNSPELRAQQISAGTGVPEPYEVAFKLKVRDCMRAERQAHQALSEYRVSNNREFFAVPLQVAVQNLHNIAQEIGILPDDEPILTAETSEQGLTNTGDTPPAPVHSPAAGKSKKVSRPPKHAHRLEGHLSRCEPLIRELFQQLRDRVLRLDSSIDCNVWTYGVAFKCNQNFIELYFKKKELDVCLRPCI